MTELCELRGVSSGSSSSRREGVGEEEVVVGSTPMRIAVFSSSRVIQTFCCFSSEGVTL